MVWSKALSDSEKTKIRDFFANYGDTDEEKAVLKNMQLGKFLKSSDDQLLPIRQLELFKQRTTISADDKLEAADKARKLADIDADIFSARSASLVAQAELDELGPYAIPLHHDAPRLISLIKVINDEAFFRVADNALQVHGGTGLLQNSPEEKLFRVARNLKIPAGTVEIQRNAIARGLLRR